MLPSVNCAPGESVFDAIQYGIEVGKFPQNARLGNRVIDIDNPPENAVGYVTVRRGEHYWVVRND